MKLPSLFLVVVGFLLVAAVVRADDCNFAAPASGESLVVGRGEPVTLTAKCVATCGNTTVYADDASFTLSTGNVTLLDNVSTGQLAPGIFTYVLTPPNAGNYLATFTCNFPGDDHLLVIDDVTVTEPWTSYLFPVFGLLALFFSYKRRSLLFFAAVCFLLTVIIMPLPVILAIILLLLSIGLVFEAAKVKGKNK